MSIELDLLLAVIGLGFVHIFLAGAAATHQRGVKWNLSARDGQQAPLTGIAARLARASSNFKETFPLAATVILLAHILNVHTSMTVTGCYLYFWGRVVYVPLYAFGVPVVRTLIWCTATAGIFIVLAAVVTVALNAV